MSGCYTGAMVAPAGDHAIGSAAAVAHYYDVNTRGFLWLGVGRHERVIHRGVWAEGVATRAAASHFVHDLMLQEMRGLPNATPRLLDLGCGVGGSLSYLLDRAPAATGHGVTISDAQLSLAGRGRHPRAQFVKADFCRDPLPVDIDLAFAIESFVHAAHPSAFFENVARALRPGARLVVVDDFRSTAGPQTRQMSRFIDGWQAPSLVHPHEADTIARICGLDLVADRDLTPHLQLSRPRDRALAAFVAVLRPVASSSLRFQALAGGDALRWCLAHGLITYRWRVWFKRS